MIRVSSICCVLFNFLTLKSSGHHFEPILGNTSPIIRLVLFMVVVGHVILGFSQRTAYWLFSMSKYILQTTLQTALNNVPFSEYFSKILDKFPLDIRAATDKFNLEPKADIYAVCPSCHKTFKPIYQNQIPTYRGRCNSRRFQTRCREILTRTRVIRGTPILVPIIPYIVFDFKDWMGNMLSRKGYEEKMDGAWNRIHESPADSSMNDIFQGSRVREFKGHDGRHFSESGPENSGRYLFSLGFDFFNPLRNLANGKRVSVGVIALVCLNLPIDLRYKPENIFLAGIIPGPKEPDFDHINPYFKPIVDIFHKFWFGIFFSKTCLSAVGRMILCALLLLICDLPAARKAGGYVSAQHERYCSVCFCTRTITPYDNYEYHTWKKRTDEDWRENAYAYKNAAAEPRQKVVTTSTGLRYTEFLRLPYYNATKSLVVDPMHNLFLGLIKEHFQNILGYGKSKKDLENIAGSCAAVVIDIDPNNPGNPPPEKPDERSGVKKLVSDLQKPLEHGRSVEETLDKMVKLLTRDSNVRRTSYIYVGKGLGCLPLSMNSSGKIGKKSYTKADMALCIAKWVSDVPYSNYPSCLNKYD